MCSDITKQLIIIIIHIELGSDGAECMLLLRVCVMNPEKHSMQASYRYRCSGEGSLDIAAYTTKAMDNRRFTLAVALFCQVWIAECEFRW